MLHWQLALTNAVRMAAAAGNIRLLQHFVCKANYGHFVYKQAIGGIHKIRDARRGGGCLIGSHAIVQQGGGWVSQAVSPDGKACREKFIPVYYCHKIRVLCISVSCIL